MSPVDTALTELVREVTDKREFIEGIFAEQGVCVHTYMHTYMHAWIQTETYNAYVHVRIKVLDVFDSSMYTQ